MIKFRKKLNLGSIYVGCQKNNIYSSTIEEVIYKASFIYNGLTYGGYLWTFEQVISYIMITDIDVIGKLWENKFAHNESGTKIFT